MAARHSAAHTKMTPAKLPTLSWPPSDESSVVSVWYEHTLLWNLPWQAAAHGALPHVSTAPSGAVPLRGEGQPGHLHKNHKHWA